MSDPKYARLIPQKAFLDRELKEKDRKYYDLYINRMIHSLNPDHIVTIKINIDGIIRIEEADFCWYLRHFEPCTKKEHEKYHLMEALQ